MNNTSLGDKGLHHIVSMIVEKIKENSTVLEQLDQRNKIRKLYLSKPGVAHYIDLMDDAQAAMTKKKSLKKVGSTLLDQLMVKPEPVNDDDPFARFSKQNL